MFLKSVGAKPSDLGKPLRKKKTAAGVKPKYKAFEVLFEKPFFSLSLDIVKERGGGTTLHYWVIGFNPSDDVVNSICNNQLVSCRYI